MQRIFAWMMAALLLVAGCQAAAFPSAETPGRSATETVDLSEIKRYLQANVQVLEETASALAAASDRYYALASEANFDYAALWRRRSAEAVEALTAARTAWMTASPLYEKVEGIVAGTPALATFDVILDAGASGEEDPENAAPIDLTLPDGRTLPRPGNLFGVTESTLWGADPDYVLADVTATGMATARSALAKWRRTPMCSKAAQMRSISTLSSSLRQSKPGSPPRRKPSPR